MGFIMDGLDTESYDRQYSDRVLLRRILTYFRPYRRHMALVGLLIMLSSVVGTGVPVLISRALDALAHAPGSSGWLVLVAGVLALGIASWSINYLRQSLSARVVGDVVLQLRRDVFGASIEHDLSFFDEHPTGMIVSRVTADTQDFSQVVTLSMDLLSQVMTVTVLSLWLLSISPPLTLVLFAMSPIAVAIALSFRRIARAVTRQARRVRARINAQIQESISGIVVAKSFRQEGALYSRFRANNLQAFAVGVRRGLTLGTIFPLMGMTSALGTALLIYLGGVQVSRGAITPGNWFLFMEAVGFYWFPMMSIASFWSQFQDGLAAAERVFALIDAEPAVVQIAAEPVPELRGSIAFRHVCLTYTGAETVLPDLNLEIAAGETVALVGHTGSGKTSIARLIGRFYEFQEGEILIDGRDIRRLDLAQYRRHIGFVPQDPFLFSGTVRDNIRYGRPETTEEEVVAAAKAAQAHDFILQLPQGYDTHIEERGGNLSGGQKQRIAIARALTMRPKILILDDSTSSVDVETETKIQDALEELMAHCTSFVVAQRISTVLRADKIVVIDRGRVVAQGTHAELMRTSPIYQEIYESQLGGRPLDTVIASGAKQSPTGNGANFTGGAGIASPAESASPQ